MGDISRRKFVSTVAGAGAAMTIVPRHVLGHGIQAPSDTLNIAVVGFGMGASNAQALMSQNLVAFCDVHDSRMAAAIKRFEAAAAASPTAAQRGGGSAQKSQPSKAQQEANARRPAQNSRENARRFVDQNLPKLKKYRDYREMLEKQKDIDAVVIATPDHMHAPIATLAMDLGKHVYVQKPLCWSVEEARVLAKKAKDRKVVTPDGQPGPLDRRRADRLRADRERRDRRSARGARLDEPAARLLAAGHSASGAARRRSEAAARLGRPRRRQAPCRGVRRQLSEARRSRLEPVPRRRARSRLPPDLSPVQLARLGGLGPGRTRRHGRASRRSSVLGAEPRLPDDGRDAVDAVQRRLVSVGDDDVLRVPEARQPAAGEADVVRRRPAAAEARGHRRRAHEPGRRADVRRHQGQADSGHLRSGAAALSVAASGVEDARRRRS